MLSRCLCVRVCVCARTQRAGRLVQRVREELVLPAVQSRELRLAVQVQPMQGVMPHTHVYVCLSQTVHAYLKHVCDVCTCVQSSHRVCTDSQTCTLANLVVQMHPMCMLYDARTYLCVYAYIHANLISVGCTSYACMTRVCARVCVCACVCCFTPQARKPEGTENVVDDAVLHVVR
jgi:hypothetical protein